MNKNIYICSFIVLIFMAMGCKKPYNPQVISDDNHYLVVEGVINSGNDSTIISLSRTVKLQENVSTRPETNYTVVVEGEQGGNYTLQPQDNGKYATGPLPLDVSKRYRLHLTSADGKEYASDYAEVKQNPPIDSIGFMPKNNALQIYVNTHDAGNNTRYYRWDYAETWKFHARFQSGFIVDYVNKEIRNRQANEDIYTCFTGDISSNIIIGSSAKLAQDVIFQGPLTTIPRDAEKIGIRYSILLKQYALTKEAYQFWENLKKNTEQLGSIFDAQPTQLTGNVHNISNPAELVIGYISITNTQSKRIFIDNSQLPEDWLVKYPYDCLAPDSALFYNAKTNIAEVQAYIINGGGVLVNSIASQMTIIGYTYSTESCTDCTIRGRVQQPSFWK